MSPKCKQASIVAASRACTQLMNWHTEGRKIPGYTFARGHAFLGVLLDIPTGYQTTVIDFCRAYEASGSNLLEVIDGPHGWAALQIAIIQAKAKGRL